MADAFEDQDWVRTGVAAAMLRSLDSGSQATLDAVAKLLTSALPNRIKVESKGLLTRKICKVSLSLDDDVLALEIDSHDALVASRVHTSRGISLKREVRPIQEWVAALVELLEEKARNDSVARDALEAWLR
jgi:hypothetical protein